jgi:hypothetical protein
MVLSKKLLLVIGWFTSALSLVFLYFHSPAEWAHYHACFLYSVTGLYCAGCGTVRSAYLLLHLRFIEAFRENPLFIVLLPFAAYILFGFTVNMWLGRKAVPQVFNKTGWAIALVILLFIYSVLRNIQVYPFTLLSPL